MVIAVNVCGKPVAGLEREYVKVLFPPDCFLVIAATGGYVNFGRCACCDFELVCPLVACIVAHEEVDKLGVFGSVELKQRRCAALCLKDRNVVNEVAHGFVSISRDVSNIVCIFEISADYIALCRSRCKFGSREVFRYRDEPCAHLVAGCRVARIVKIAANFNRCALAVSKR